MKLHNKVAVITGATSPIGEAIAKMYANEGAKVIIADYKEAATQTVAKKITDEGNTAKAVQVDFTKQTDIDRMIDTAIEAYGTVDILVNHAGMEDDYEPIADIPDEKWDKVFDMNTKSTMRAIRKTIPIFREKGSGVIINTASTAGLNGAHTGVAYTASKHAVIGITKNTAYMYANDGIRCNAIAESVDGGVHAGLGETAQHINPFGVERTRPVHSTMPRNGTRNEIAKVALFLASNDSSIVNGAVITADAGWSAAF